MMAMPAQPIRAIQILDAQLNLWSAMTAMHAQPIRAIQLLDAQQHQ
jgi:hypothetical protein